MRMLGGQFFFEDAGWARRKKCAASHSAQFLIFPTNSGSFGGNLPDTRWKVRLVSRFKTTAFFENPSKKLRIWVNSTLG